MRQEMNEKMGPIGVWATGKCDWDPKNGLTGIKPVVDHYSITRFSTHEWQQRNDDVYAENSRVIQQNVEFVTNFRQNQNPVPL